MDHVSLITENRQGAPSGGLPGRQPRSLPRREYYMAWCEICITCAGSP